MVAVGGTRTQPSSSTAHATLRDNVPVVINVSKLVFSAVKLIGTPKIEFIEVQNYTKR